MGVETALAIGSLAVTAYTTYESFERTNKEKALANEAQSAAAKAMVEARKNLDVNVYKKLAVPMQTYEKVREDLTRSGAEATAAGIESERGVAATAGRVQMAMGEALDKQRAAIEEKISNLETLTATEEGRLKDLKTDLYLSEAGAKQLEKRDAEIAAAMYEQQGWQGVTSAVGQAAQFVPLYLRQRQPESGIASGAANAPVVNKQTGAMQGAASAAARMQGNVMPTKPTLQDFIKTNVSPYSTPISSNEQSFLDYMNQQKSIVSDPNYFYTNPFQPY